MKHVNNIAFNYSTQIYLSHYHYATLHQNQIRRSFLAPSQIYSEKNTHERYKQLAQTYNHHLKSLNFHNYENKHHKSVTHNSLSYLYPFFIRNIWNLFQYKNNWIVSELVAISRELIDT